MTKQIRLLFLMLSATISAQYSVSGVLMNDHGKAITDAEIILKGKNTTIKTASSNHLGNYEIDDVLSGNYQLIVRKHHHENVFNISVKNTNIVFNPKFEKSRSKDIEQVNLMKFRSIKSEKEKEGFAVNIIETEKESLKNVQTNDLLDRTVGIKLRQNGGLGSRVDYNLNGMSGNSVRILIDGLPISTYGSSFSLNSIPPALIERIEVYKGVIPAHLSDDALGGVINVILKKGAKNTLNASVSYGSFNTFQANVFGLYRAENGLTAKVSSFFNQSDNDYKIWGEKVYNILPNGRLEETTAKRFNDAYRSYGGRMELGYSYVKWADNFSISYNSSSDYKEIQHGQFMTKPYKGRFTEAQSHVLGLDYSKRDFLLKGLDFSFNGVYGDSKTIINDTVKWNYNWNGEIALGLDGKPIRTPNGAQQGRPTIEHNNRKTYTFRSSIGYRLGNNHTLTLNNMYYSLDRNDYDELRTTLENTYIKPRDLSKNITSLSYELRAFDKKLKANIFGKHYSQNITKTDPVIVSENGVNRVEMTSETGKFQTYGYGLASSYLIKNAIVILASAEKAVRMPNDNEIFGNAGENLTSNFHLKPEISNNFNLGLKFGPYRISEHSVSLSGAGFVRNTQDKIVIRINDRINDAIQTNPLENLGKTQSIGFEAELGYRYKKDLNVLMSLSKFNTLYKLRYDANGKVLDYYNRQIPNEPFFNANANVQYGIRNFIQKHALLSLNYNFAYTKSFENTWQKGSTFTPNQLVHDFGVSYAFPSRKFVASFDVRNFLNAQVFDNYAVQKPGRAFYLKLNYIINKFN
ncbi:MAG: TonB-dependent receptor [Cruoricaptor ignavus]|nr:TonB-dependent receptor [Cruoricaptor ignavus]